MAEMREPLIPAIGVVTDIRIDTPDVKTFRVVTPDGKKAFEHKPGQCAMLSIPGVGEAMYGRVCRSCLVPMKVMWHFAGNTTKKVNCGKKLVKKRKPAPGGMYRCSMNVR